MAKQSYVDFVADLKSRLGEDEAMRRAVGGDFFAVGALQRQLLESLGLRDGQCVVDVGCGSGRLACQLAAYEHLRFMGFDVVPDLISYAKRLCHRDDWEFDVTDGARIRVADGTADFVCFFSVFTHLLQEDCYRYLQEAMRVLRPGGRIVLSFLEFRLIAHWPMFNARSGHLNQFIERDTLLAWARQLGLVVESIHGGDQPHIPLHEDVTWEDGRVMRGKGHLGQSVAVLRVPSPPVATAVQEDTAPSQPHAPEPLPSPIIRIAAARAYVGVGAANLRLSIMVRQNCDLWVRASTRILQQQGYGHLLAAPSLLFFDATGSAIAANAGWQTLPQTTQGMLRELLPAAGSEAQGLDGTDAGLWLQLADGEYSIAVADRQGKEGLIDLEVFQALPSRLR
ncbi:hypothetical protein DB354_14715 [Opitutus sp. ER46]|nr:hypothetical protein DB354_14715 [Opitutus sp. ER46]